MEQKINEYREWLASEIVRLAKIAEPYAHHQYDAVVSAFSSFNALFPIPVEDNQPVVGWTDEEFGYIKSAVRVYINETSTDENCESWPVLQNILEKASKTK